MALVAVTRDDLDSAGLRAAAAGTSDPKQARRLLALIVLLAAGLLLMPVSMGGFADLVTYTSPPKS